MNAHKPKRYYLTYGDHDYVTDSVTGSDGREHLVTMRGWHWYNLDWINTHTDTSEKMLVDNAVIGIYEVQGMTLSKALEASVFFYINSYHNTRTGKTAKEITGEKGTLGSA
jgi:hypothetical protein